MEKNRVTVTIDGREYPVASVESVEHIENVAQLVDSKVRELRRSAVLNHEIALVFACLNLADELVKIKGLNEPQKIEETGEPENKTRRGTKRGPKGKA